MSRPARLTRQRRPAHHTRRSNHAAHQQAISTPLATSITGKSHAMGKRSCFAKSRNIHQRMTWLIVAHTTQLAA